MDDKVVIKGNQHGLTIIVKEQLPVDQINEILGLKLNASRKFFGNAAVTITIRGQKFSDAEQETIIEVIQENSDLIVSCLVDEDSHTTKHKMIKSVAPVVTKSAVTEPIVAKSVASVDQKPEQRRYFEKETTAVFKYGTLRSGQLIEVKDSLVFVGNVHAGSTIKAPGNVIVVGSLKGNVHAGFGGNHKAYVVALEMRPTQVRIGSYIGRSPDYKKKHSEPMVAFVEDDNIYIEEVNPSIFEGLNK